MSNASSDTNLSVFSFDGMLEMETDSSDPDTHTAEGYTYGRREVKGTKLQKWIDGDTEVECRVKPVKLTWGDIVALGARAKLKDIYSRENARLLSSIGIDLSQYSGPGPNGEFAKLSILQEITADDYPSNVESDAEITLEPAKYPRRNRWEAYIGKGVICMSELFRWYKVGLFSSEVIHTFYTRYYPIESLTCCFVCSVINVNTTKFIERLYTKKGYPFTCLFGDNWREVAKVRVWEFGTAEYKALLGTRVGGVVASLVLGAFPPGTKRITSIQTNYKPINTPNPEMFILNMKFEISTMETGTPLRQDSAPIDSSACT